MLLVCCAGARTHAQVVTCSGKVADSSGAPLPHANILAHPEAEDSPVFAIANEQGLYELKLHANTAYGITVSYLGYVPKTLVVTTGEKDFNQDFQLLPDTTMLDGVVVNAKVPLVVKKDTLIYQTAAFASGEERKLRELLKKLPGVEVSKEGKISVQGKEVTKVLVEGRPFFTGGSRLAVDHIPADAVAQVEVLDNYQELALLKGLQDSEDMAMNIRLKEDKKDFAFGDIGISGGPRERYSIQPNLFYYSPRTAVNAIGDVNNKGQKAFTLNDYMEFEGGFGSLLQEHGSLYNQSREDLRSLLSNQDFKESAQEFGAVNLRHSLSANTTVNSYVILSGERKSSRTETWNQYTAGPDGFTESRIRNGNHRNLFLIGKLRVDHTPSPDEAFVTNGFIKVTGNTFREKQFAATSFQQNNIQSQDHVKGMVLKQHFRYSKRLSAQHTLLAESSFHYQKDIPRAQWAGSQPLFQQLFPLSGPPLLDIFQNKDRAATAAGFLVKDYWQLNPLNHLYFSAGIKISRDRFRSDTYSFSSGPEATETGGSSPAASDRVSLSTNNLLYRTRNIFAGLEYKFKRGIFTFKPALFYHYYTWDVRQAAGTVSRGRPQLQPEFSVTAGIRKTQRLHFRYRMETRLPSVAGLASGLLIQDFNEVSQGNPRLDNERYHTFALSYSSIRLPNTFFNAGITYQVKARHIKKAILLPLVTARENDGYFGQIHSFVMLDQPENSLLARAGFSKKIRRIRYTLRGNYTRNDFFQVVNDIRIKNRSRSLVATFKAATSFNRFPHVELGYTANLTRYRTGASASRFTSNELFGNIRVALLNHFLLQMDYSRSYYKTPAAVPEVFEMAGAFLGYQREDSPWGYKLSVSNLLNNRLRRENTFSTFYISDQRTFILPRILLFTLSYKL